MHNRKLHVMQVAQRLFLENGFFGTSVKDIIEKAAISKGTFYNYFASKNECLIAILSHAQQETFSRRKQLLLNQSPTNRLIFAKQIIVRIELNREQNLLPLFGFIFHSKDEELHQFAKKYHLLELSWLSKRFIDVYGEDIYPYATDCAIFVLGLIQQYNLVWSFYVDEEINTEQLVMFVLRKMDTIVQDFIVKKENFVHEQLFMTIESLWNASDPLDDELSHALLLLKERDLVKNDEAKQYIEFIITEFQKTYPRKHLLLSILKSLKKLYTNKSDGEKVIQITNRLANIVQQKY